jgi:preprotein translocase subunit SecF
MIWGIFVATYSSVFICSPMLIYLGLRSEDQDKAPEAASTKASGKSAARAKPKTA